LLSILFLGFLIGVRHAFEADHIAAVASLAARRVSIRQTVKLGAVWGLGHTITLFLFGSVVLFLNVGIADNLAQWLEFAVGIMLILLGGDVIRRMIRDRVHFHVHTHDGGVRHFHAHSHRGQRVEREHPERHAHEHVSGFPVRALLVGLMHGMAGSSALILLTLKTIAVPAWGLVYIALFGVGSILGMALVGLAFAIPLRSARPLTWLHNGLQGCIGTMTVLVGVITVATVGIF